MMGGYLNQIYHSFQSKGKEAITLQLFIEPKETHLLEYDKWKEDFLFDIQEKFETKH